MVAMERWFVFAIKTRVCGSSGRGFVFAIKTRVCGSNGKRVCVRSKSEGLVVAVEI